MLSSVHPSKVIPNANLLSSEKANSSGASSNHLTLRDYHRNAANRTDGIQQPAPSIFARSCHFWDGKGNSQPFFWKEPFIMHGNAAEESVRATFCKRSNCFETVHHCSNSLLQRINQLWIFVRPLAHFNHKMQTNFQFTFGSNDLIVIMWHA